MKGTTPIGRRHARHGRGGFTMLEALLALFIFSTAVISLLEAVNATGRAVIASRRERAVQARLENLLLEATRSPELLSKMKSTQPQESKAQEGDVTFVTRTAPLELKNKDGLLLPDMMSISITALWKEGREPQEVSADTWIHVQLFLPRSSMDNRPPLPQ